MLSSWRSTPVIRPGLWRARAARRSSKGRPRVQNLRCKAGLPKDVEACVEQWLADSSNEAHNAHMRKLQQCGDADALQQLLGSRLAFGAPDRVAVATAPNVEQVRQQVGA